MSQTSVPRAWASASGVGVSLISASLGKNFCLRLLHIPGPHQFPAALPFSHVLESVCIFGNWSQSRAFGIWIRGGQAAGKL